jgi:hypothetical protein
LYIGKNAGPITGRVENNYNTGIGANALYGSTGYWNTAIGMNSMYNQISGMSNTAIGYFSGANITSGNYNVSIGQAANDATTTGTHNMSLGLGAGAGYNKSYCLSLGHYTNYHPYNNCLHISQGYNGISNPQCNGV